MWVSMPLYSLRPSSALDGTLPMSSTPGPVSPRAKQGDSTCRDAKVRKNVCPVVT